MDKLFEKYRKRLKWIGTGKSIVLSLAIALISAGIVAIFTLITKCSVLHTLALSLGISGGVFLISTFIIYFKYFRPTNEMVAKQLDLLGLDARIITMYEFEENNSVMARLQREDAKSKLSAISPKRLKFKVALPVVILLAFGIIFAAGTTTASMIYSTLPSKITSQPLPAEQTEYFTITYKVFEAGTGSIDGNSSQKVKKGSYTQKVTAVPSSGFRFKAWVDEEGNYLANQNNPRFEVNVQKSATIFALFEKQQTTDESTTPGDDKEDGSKDPEIDKGGNEGEGEQGGEGQPSGGQDSGPGREDNNVIDGNQNYKDNFDRKFYEDELAGRNLPDELKDILGDYYGTLKP